MVETTKTAPGQSISSDILFGGISAVTGKTIVAPIERVKLLLQTQETIVKLKHGHQYKGIIDCFVRLVREEGVLSLWRGNMMNVFRYAPVQAFNFGFNGLFQKRICQFDPKTDPKKYVIGYFLSGGLAGVISTIIFYPLDFVRTRLATDVGKLKSEREFTGVTSCFRTVYQKEGVVGLYRGLGLALFVVFFYRGIYFGGSTLGKKHLGIINEYRALKLAFYHLINLGAGAFLHPFDTVRRRLMMQQGRPVHLRDYNGTLDTIKVMYQREGWRGYFKGGLGNVIRSLSSTLVMFFFDEFSAKANRK
jgi:solute carrier family 25 (adenine nucleotide translocator) protein 4/5/6/31